MKRLFKKHLAKTYSDMRQEYATFLLDDDVNNVEEMVNNPRNIFWDVKTKNYALYTPMNDGRKIILTTLPEELLIMFREMMTKKHFHIKMKHPLLEIHGASKHSSAFLLLPNLEETLNQYIDLGDEICFLISDRINLPIYVGHKTTIGRLAESSDFNYQILTWEEVK